MIDNLAAVRQSQQVQLVLGLLFGIAFGFLLQKAGVTYYDVIIGQLLLTDFTVIKVMLSAVIPGVIGFHLMKRAGLVNLHVMEPAIGTNVIGGLIFGLGFGLLGYCPGTLAGAAGAGALDALVGGVIGMLIGVGIFADIFPSIKNSILASGRISKTTLPELLGVGEWTVIIPVVILSGGFLLALEMVGL